MELELRCESEDLLEAALPAGTAREAWHVARTELARLAFEGDERARRLRLWVDVSLVGSVPEEQAELRVAMQSDAWAQGSALPPVHYPRALAAAPTRAPDAPLAWEIVEVLPLERTGADGFWLKYLGSGAAGGWPAAKVPAGDLLGTLARWLGGELGVGTVGGALSCARSGPAGVFGPVRHTVLERSGQADLAVEATRLAEASDGEDEGAAATRLLTLYGERFGAWLLHRRRLLPRKVRRNEPEPPPLYDCDVLVADTAEDLVRLAGLDRVEKRLFEAAGVLPPDTLDAHYQEKADAGEGASMAVDLSDVADKPRRYLQAIIALARQGGLSQLDLDLLLRTARQLSRSRR